MRKRLVTVLWVVMISFLIAITGCPKPTTMSAKQQATIWLNIYNAEYEDTMAVMTSPNSTPAQRSVGAKKKDVLTKIWPLLQLYTSIIDGGGTPSEQTTKQLVYLINELITATGGK